MLRECADSRDLEESLFSTPIKLHLTLGVMCIMNNEEDAIVSSLFANAMNDIVAYVIYSNIT